MGRICAVENVTLDGVMQSPGRPDEDTRGGFRHGGWGDGYADEVIGKFMAAGMASSGAMLFGHRTYEDVLHHWTTTAEPNPFADVLVNADKYVVSRHADTRLSYPNSTLVAGDAAETVATLKKEFDGGLTVIGSGELVRSLHAAGLIDEYLLLVYPIVLGSGARLFGDDDRADLALVESVPSTTGVLIARYRVR